MFADIISTELKWIHRKMWKDGAGNLVLRIPKSLVGKIFDMQVSYSIKDIYCRKKIYTQSLCKYFYFQKTAIVFSADYLKRHKLNFNMDVYISVNRHEIDESFGLMFQNEYDKRNL